MKLRILVLLLLISTGAAAQMGNDARKSSSDRWFTGGNVWLNFGTNTTVVGATPRIGYHITDIWNAGIGVTGLYYRFTIPGYTFSSGVYGGNAFTRVNITEQVFLTTEYHLINTKAWSLSGESLGRKTVPLWYVGGGYQYSLGGNAYFVVTLMYDLIQDPNSPFQNPSYQGGVIFGL